MIGSPFRPSGMRGSGDACRFWRAVAKAASSRATIAATALCFALVLPSVDSRGELLFRSAEQVNGELHWSALKKYANPADTAYPRVLADGTELTSEPVQVSVQGTITQQDIYGAKVLESLVKRGRQTIAGNQVSFSGDGGDVDAAMAVGRVLRRLGVIAVVARGEQCLSSCVFAFMGGDRRAVDGRLGIHRPYLSSTRKVADRRLYYRQLQKRLQQYIDDLDFPPSLFEAVMSVPPESISFLTAVDLKRFYLQGMSPSAEDEADAAAAGNLGISVTEYLLQKAQRPSCAGVLRADNTCDENAQPLIGIGAAPADSGNPNAFESAPTAVGSVARP